MFEHGIPAKYDTGGGPGYEKDVIILAFVWIPEHSTFVGGTVRPASLHAVFTEPGDMWADLSRINHQNIEHFRWERG